MSLFKKENKGMDCQENPDGSMTCRRYKIEGQEPLATGTEITIVTDPKTCKARFSGSMRINDEDKKEMLDLARSMENSCKKGF